MRLEGRRSDMPTLPMCHGQDNRVFFKFSSSLSLDIGSGLGLLGRAKAWHLKPGAHQPIHNRKVPSAIDSTLCPTMGLTSEPLKRPSRGPMTHAADRPATPPEGGTTQQIAIIC